MSLPAGQPHLIAASLSTAALILSLSIPSIADEVILVNGDKLTGQILQTNKRSVKFKTSYAGTLTIKRSEIQSLNTDEAIPVQLNEGDRILVTEMEFDDSRVLVTSPDLSQKVLDSSAVRRIYPAARGAGEFSGRTSGVLKSEQGNVDTTRFNLDLDMTYRGLSDRMNLFVEVEVEEDNSLKSRDNAELSITYSRFFTDNWYWTVVLLGEKNLRSGVEKRMAIGPRLGYQFFESKQLNLTFEAGMLWHREDLVVPQENESSTATWYLNYDQFIVDDLVANLSRAVRRFSQ